MKSIFASKLYRASKRKDRIQAALASPNNLALAQQLAEDLDEQYKTPENLGLESEKVEEVSEDDELNDFIVDEEIDPSKDLVTMDDVGKSSGGGHSSKMPSSPKSSSSESPDKDDKVDKDSEKPDTSDLMPESPGNEKVEIRTILPMNIVFDHRVLDFGEVRPFLTKMEEFFQNPELILNDKA